MLFRKIENQIVSHLKSDDDRILVIDGARQIGKSFIIREVGKRLFKNFIEINMEVDKLSSRTFENAKTIDDFYLALSIDYGHLMKEKKDTLIFIDEIQAYDHLLTMLKFLREDNRYTFIASGSQLGITLKLTSSLPIGSIRILHMYPMDFEEFLIANNVGELVIDTLRKNFEKRVSMPANIHTKIMDLFKKYLLVGGLPYAVKTFVESKNITTVRSIQTDIQQLYKADAARYEQNNTRLKIQRIYDMIPSNLENKKKRIVAKDIEQKDGKRMNDYEEEFDYLISAGIALEVKAISKPTFPLIENSGKNLLKLYINDVGLLTNIFFGTQIKPIMEDVNSINLGSVYETIVAQELKAHGFNLFYYDNKKNGEVDYLIDDKEHLSVLPIEVKSGKDYTIHSALDRFIENKDYNIQQAFVFSNNREVKTQNSITYLPIYYVAFVQAQ